MVKTKYLISSLIALGCACAASAMTPGEAKAAFEAGDYAEAVETLRAIADKEPRNASANSMAGIALMRTGNLDAARKYLLKGTNEAKIHLAELDFYNYDFDAADEWLDKYATAQKKARKPESEEAERVRARIETGRSMLDRVEKIAIIDSIAVPREDFFSFYRLASSAGSIDAPSALPQGFSAADPTSVYVSEDGNTMLWSAPDADENFGLVQSSRLADGSWETPASLGTVLNEGGDANYPFLMSDGVTLYFANDGENSLGGYDIFISRNDGEKYLQPQNIGMPYNSPYDDYLLAIDEETGIGWWATDRNSMTDSITIYRFVPQELRINYPVDTENLPALAMVKDYRATWGDNDYTALNDRVKSIRHTRREHKADFRFGLPDGSVRTSIESFHSAQARSLMQDYLDQSRKIDDTRAYLAKLRAQYRSGNTSASADITSLEAELPRMKARLKEIAGMIVNAEM